MDNKQVWDHYQSYTKDITEYSRKLGFAGVAICWIFKSPSQSSTLFPGIIYSALFFFVVFFVLDVLQGLLGAIPLRYWIYREEKKAWNTQGKIEVDYQKPKWLDRGPFSAFILKLIFLFIGFYCIGKHILTTNISIVKDLI